ncbi:MAG: inositol monophosphatase, partial [Thiotrichaceae bacterium]|nr:inositol monophosphatase [Thiotrichaceae bacterium]
MADQTLLRKLEQLIPAISDKILNEFFNRTTAEKKSDGSIVTEADLAMQNALTEELSHIAPDIRMLSEEMTS